MKETINKSSWFDDDKQALQQMVAKFNIKADSLVSRLSQSTLTNYQVKDSVNIFSYKGITFKHYPFLFHLENITRSTQHAQQYIYQGIWYKNAKMLLPLVLFFSLLLGIVRYFKIEELAIFALLMALGLFVYTTFSSSENETAFNKMVKGLSYFHIYCVFVFASVLTIVFTFIRKKNKPFYYTLLGAAFVLLGILLSHILGLYITDQDFYTTKLPGFNFALTENHVQLYPIPFICTFIGLFAMWFTTKSLG